MSIFLLLLIIAVLMVVVRSGAIALELTGVPKTIARFQALSALTGTGFTTREAETVVQHPLRRRIISVLMIVGNIGVVTIVSTFVIALQGGGPIRPSINLIILGIGVYVFYRLATHRRFLSIISIWIRRKLKEALPLETDVLVDEVMHQGLGFGISRLTISGNSGIAGKTVEESGIREQEAIILSIERDGAFIPVPKAARQIEEGDRLLCYGRTESLRRLVETA